MKTLRDIKGKQALINKQRRAKAFQSKLNFSKGSLIDELFGIELVDNVDKFKIIESIVEDICDLLGDVEKTSGTVVHQKTFKKKLKRKLQEFYFYLPKEKKYIYGGVAYCEVTFGREPFVRLNDPCELLKEKES